MAMKVTNLFRKTAAKEWYEKNNCTYYGIKLEATNLYVMGFTLRITQGVRAGGRGESGWICEARHVNSVTDRFSCFLATSSSRSVTKFLSDIAQTPGMPAIMAPTLDNRLLALYLVWKTTMFADHCKEHGLEMDKLPILRRNLQEDGHTYCFSSEMYFLRTDGVVKPISPAAAHYVWVQAKLANLVPLLPYNGQGDTDVLEIIRAKLQDDNMPDNFICFLLVCGHTNILSLHYQELLHTFGHIPALIATGPRSTGKTLSTEVSVGFLGLNAEKICVVKDLTPSALRDRYANDHFPLILHDCKNPDTIVTALMECFEGKDVQKHESQQAPGTTLSVTCNERTMEYLQSNFAALSRAVVIPMLEEMSPMTEVQLTDVLRGKQTAAKHFAALLNLTEEDKRELKKRAFGLRETVTNAMSGVTDSHHRISENYSILTAATKLFLKKTGYSVWIPKVLPFMLEKLLPSAGSFYKYRISNDSSIQAANSSLTLSSSKNLIIQLCDALQKLQENDQVIISEFVKFLPEKKFLAIREHRFLQALEESEIPQIDFSELKSIPSVLSGKKALTVRFHDEKTARVVSFPSTLFSATQAVIIGDTSRKEPESRHEKEDGRIASMQKAPVSPFKALNAPVPPRNSLEPVHVPPQFEPAGTSTPNAASVNLRSPRNFRSPVGNPENLVADVSANEEESLGDLDNQVPQPSVSVNKERSTLASLVADPAVTPSPQAFASFSLTSQVAGSPSSQSEPASRPPKKPKNAKCSGCDNNEDMQGSENTFLCSVCKKRFHMGCQDTHEKYWPARENAKCRKCNECRAENR